MSLRVYVIHEGLLSVAVPDLVTTNGADLSDSEVEDAFFLKQKLSTEDRRTRVQQYTSVTHISTIEGACVWMHIL